MGSYEDNVNRLIEIGADYYRRGWIDATSGNFSFVESRSPLILAVTRSGLDKGRLKPADILKIDENGKLVEGEGKTSDETPLHLTLVKLRGAGAVFHTHSDTATVLSEYHGRGDKPWEIGFEGYEMEKALKGIKDHKQRERIPIIENSQDMQELVKTLEQKLKEYPDTHGFLLKNHGLYSWGDSIEEANRHIQAIEFLLRVKEKWINLNR